MDAYVIILSTNFFNVKYLEYNNPTDIYQFGISAKSNIIYLVAFFSWIRGNRDNHARHTLHKTQHINNLQLLAMIIQVCNAHGRSYIGSRSYLMSKKT